MSSLPQYEFTHEQNEALADLAGKMRFVGFFSVLFGLLGLLICLFTVLFLFQDRIPADFRDKATTYWKKAHDSLPEDLKKQAADYTLDRIPRNNSFLIGLAIFTGVAGLIFFLQGVWTRSAGSSFRKIVRTEGRDISHLMNAVGSLRSMYGQVYLLLMLALLAGLIAVGLTAWKYYSP